ncbi:MAG: hypothetical protein ACON38_16970 [Akkermansiaceae bacterium]
MSALFLGSCSSNKASTTAGTQDVPFGYRWYVASRNPMVTFFPKGLSKTADTGYRDGRWLVSNDRVAGWFIPRKGVAGRDEKQLLAEATLLRKAGELGVSEKQARKELSDEEAQRYANKVFLSTLTIPVDAALILGAAMGGVAGEPILTPVVWDHL